MPTTNIKPAIASGEICSGCKEFKHLMQNGPMSRHQLRMQFAYDYGASVMARTVDSMIAQKLAVEDGGLIKLNEEIVK